METRAIPAHSLEHGDAFDAVAVFEDYDRAILASLRTSADEDEIVAALETQLARQAREIAAQETNSSSVVPFRRRARTHAEQRAA